MDSEVEEEISFDTKRQIAGFYCLAFRNDITIKEGVPESSKIYPIDMIKLGITGCIPYLLRIGHIEKIDNGEIYYRFTSSGLEEATKVVDFMNV